MRRVWQLAAWTVLGVGVCMASAPVAQGNKNKTDTKTEKKADKESTGDQTADKTFAQKAGAINLAEVNLGQLAARLAANPEVKQYGQRLAQNHYQANDQLNAVLGKAGIPAAPEMDQQHAALWKKLAGTAGPNFDHEFLEAMVKGHKEAIQLFQGEARDGRNAALKQYAQQSLPTLQEHLKVGQDLLGKTKASGTDKKKTEEPEDR